MSYLDVTQADIDNGTPSYRHGCPMALALARKFPTGTSDVRPSGLKSISSDGSILAEYYCTLTMLDWIFAFDRGKKVRPHRFRLQRHHGWPML